MIVSLDALQGADSLGTSAALTEKELNKTDTIDMMDMIEDLYETVTLRVCGTLDITYQGTEIHMGEWTRMTMAEAVKEYVGIDFMNISDDAEAVLAAKKAGM